uniref:Uncharacterized protein n=1 Tax=Heterorhabditis bacteriophora TaxID=37862 RepID=A0A1I7X971_HETBA
MCVRNISCNTLYCGIFQAPNETNYIIYIYIYIYILGLHIIYIYISFL